VSRSEPADRADRGPDPGAGQAGTDTRQRSGPGGQSAGRPERSAFTGHPVTVQLALLAVYLAAGIALT
jgi:hypothetical protein